MANSNTTITPEFTGTFTSGASVKVPAWVIPFLHEHIVEDLNNQGSLEIQREANVSVGGFHLSPYTRNDGVHRALRKKDKGMIVLAVDCNVILSPDETVCVKLTHHEYAPLQLTFTRPSYEVKA